jgi:ankyrin repeat protein
MNVFLPFPSPSSTTHSYFDIFSHTINFIVRKQILLIVLIKMVVLLFIMLVFFLFLSLISPFNFLPPPFSFSHLSPTVHKGSIEAVNVLIHEYKANVNLLDNKKQSLLHIACLTKSAESHHIHSILPLLFSSQLNADVKDKDGNTALHILARDGDNHGILHTLLQHTTHLHITNNEHLTPASLAVLSHRLPIAQAIIYEYLQRVEGDNSEKGFEVAKLTTKELVNLLVVLLSDMNRGILLHFVMSVTEIELTGRDILTHSFEEITKGITLPFLERERVKKIFRSLEKNEVKSLLYEMVKYEEKP